MDMLATTGAFMQFRKDCLFVKLGYQLISQNKAIEGMVNCRIQMAHSSVNTIQKLNVSWTKAISQNAASLDKKLLNEK